MEKKHTTRADTTDELVLGNLDFLSASDVEEIRSIRKIVKQARPSLPRSPSLTQIRSIKTPDPESSDEEVPPPPPTPEEDIIAQQLIALAKEASIIAIMHGECKKRLETKQARVTTASLVIGTAFTAGLLCQSFLELPISSTFVEFGATFSTIVLTAFANYLGRNDTNMQAFTHDNAMQKYRGFARLLSSNASKITPESDMVELREFLSWSYTMMERMQQNSPEISKDILKEQFENGKLPPSLVIKAKNVRDTRKLSYANESRRSRRQSSMAPRMGQPREEEIMVSDLTRTLSTILDNPPPGRQLSIAYSHSEAEIITRSETV